MIGNIGGVGCMVCMWDDGMVGIIGNIGGVGCMVCIWDDSFFLLSKLHFFLKFGIMN